MTGWLVLAIAGLILVYGFYCRKRLIDLDALSILRDKFFKSSETLLDIDETPYEVLEFVDWMAERFNDKNAARHMFFYLLSRPVEARRSKHPLVDNAFAEASKTREPVEKLLAVCVVTWVLATTYNSFFFGRLLRRLTLYNVDVNNNDVHGAGDASHVVAALAA